jgi:hypothetical protein
MFVTLRTNIGSVTASSGKNIICMSIILDQGFDDFDNLASWLSSVGYRNFTFAIDNLVEAYVLSNTNRVNTLKQYGKLVPRLATYQQYAPATRQSLVDSELANFTSEVGYMPSGVFDFIPDTLTANYLLTKGVEYYQGYCFDQYAVDYMSERGGWQMPYYASSANILVPSSTDEGMVVLPHSTWDWVSSFTSQLLAGQNLQLHPLNLINKIYGNNSSAAKNYFMSMISNTFAGSQPFGFVNFQFEWSTTESAGDLDAVKEWITALNSTYPNDLWTYEGLVTWFKSMYASTPTYRINFTSPYDGQNIEWYYDTTKRVARINGEVVSYVNYSSQYLDKYLTQRAAFSWQGSSTDPSNCVDDSLIILIDALGGGYLRARGIACEAVPYSGDLAKFSFSEGLGQAADFLERLYNPSVGLCEETLVGELHNITASNGTVYLRYTNETYWIASDNYLESIALTSYNLTLSEQINQTCRTFYNGSYCPYQIMQGMSIPLTLHIPNTYALENTSDHVIALNLYNGTINFTAYLDFATCGDALVYEAVNYYVQGYPFEWCKGLYMEAYNMFDGTGVRDAHFNNTGQYDNMKLALLVFGAKVLNLSVNLTGIEKQLWNAQKSSGSEVGGITAVDDISGEPVGTANGETTAFTLLADDNALIEQIAHSQESVNGTKKSLDISFPTTNYNQTSVETNLTAIPLLGNWTATINNTIQWQKSDNPRVELGFYSNLVSNTSLSIQIVEYDNGYLDIVLHDFNCAGGCKIASINWSNPLTVSLVSNTLNVSSPAGAYVTSFPNFRLEYITAGSTKSQICAGGKVDIQAVPEFSQNLIWPLFMIVTLFAIMTKRRHSIITENRN